MARPATAEAATGRYTTDEVPTTETVAGTAYPEWMAWDDVTVSTNPNLAVELDGYCCDWCGWTDRAAVTRIDGEFWERALYVCRNCTLPAITSAARDGHVRVETTH